MAHAHAVVATHEGRQHAHLGEQQLGHWHAARHRCLEVCSSLIITAVPAHPRWAAARSLQRAAAWTLVCSAALLPGGVHWSGSALATPASIATKGRQHAHLGEQQLRHWHAARHCRLEVCTGLNSQSLCLRALQLGRQHAHLKEQQLRHWHAERHRRLEVSSSLIITAVPAHPWRAAACSPRRAAAQTLACSAASLPGGVFVFDHHCCACSSVKGWDSRLTLESSSLDTGMQPDLLLCLPVSHLEAHSPAAL